MKKQFNLSEKIRGKEWHKYDDNIVFTKDIKEFIKLLKEEMCNPKEYACICCNTMEHVLNKLAGDDLISDIYNHSQETLNRKEGMVE